MGWSFFRSDGAEKSYLDTTGLDHATLSNVTSDQHHARSHDHSSASDGTSLAPSSLVASAALKTSGILELDGLLATSVTGASLNNLDVSTYSVVVWGAASDPGSDNDLTGLVPSSAGQVILLYNGSFSRTLTVKHLSASSTTTNRVYCPDRNDYVLAPGQGCWLVYESAETSSGSYNLRWRLIEQASYSSTPTTVSTTAGSAGTANTARSRGDHTHQLATRTKKLWIPAATMLGIPGTDTTPAVTGWNTSAGATAGTDYGFWPLKDANAESGATCWVQVPDDWASGAITAIVYYTGSATSATNGVRWSIRYLQSVIGTTDMTGAGTSVAWTETVGMTQHVVQSSTSQSLWTPAATGELYRVSVDRLSANAADTYTGTIRLVGLELTYTAR